VPVDQVNEGPDDVPIARSNPHHVLGHLVYARRLRKVRIERKADSHFYAALRQALDKVDVLVQIVIKPSRNISEALSAPW
jgi:hypothetical protein